MSPGIPSSPDRQDQIATVVVGSVILIAMFIASLYVVVGRAMHRDGSSSPAQTRLDAYLDEEERASAYAALRVEMDQMSTGPGIDAVFCRDSSHSWHDDVIEFRGQVDFQMETGAMERHDYVAQLSGSKKDGWDVLSVEILPIDGEEDGLVEAP